MTESKGKTETFSVRCPICGRKVPWGPQSPWRPFCSERCRLIDLGEWGSDAYRIEGRPGSADLLDEGDAKKER
ncbi:DNA gyrase inhibitor YacG [Mesosutterella sp. OilRF-GAM-744-9]|uniref:DNA gyrase inhibitor YacG n=1 Tax=Mesosutterella porci TaxID=2915351 RepID=A0ABS9MRL2_9BURK|nr:DNA gyrase inhibitor YacG [Mesosutterella sp. oilRF-744-WT-GAM-9]MCG5031270.1 DNA gyrase inhibitor YacG [Mesosutterella sp. oilRF-744-WT-GAM-9]MCI6531003.1 DNA gyrase inhibitor YacG [Mesosutterella sp.]